MIIVGDILSTVGCSGPWGNIMSTMGGYLEYCGGYSVSWGDIMMHVGEGGDTQYHGEIS